MKRKTCSNNHSLPKIPPLKRYIMDRPTITIPFHLFGPRTPKKPQLESHTIIITRGYQPAEQRAIVAHGNKLDVLLDSETIGYFKEDDKSGATLVFPQREEVKDMILDPESFPVEASNLVILKKDGSLLPGFLPDFGDLAFLPKVLKVMLRWLFVKENNTPDLLKDLWLSVNPQLPKIRHEVRQHYGVVNWTWFNSPSRLQLVKVIRPSIKDIDIDIECEPVSESHKDGRKYTFQTYGSDKLNLDVGVEKMSNGDTYCLIDRPNVHIMVWNCQGMGRPSFIGNLHHLLEAHRPDIGVLLETSMSRHLLGSLLRDTLLYRIVGVSLQPIYGGIAVLSAHNKVHFVAEHRGTSRISGRLKGLKLMYDPPSSSTSE